MIDREGSHRGAHRRALDERDEAAHEEKARRDQRDLDVGDVNRTHEEAAQRKEVRRIGLDRRTPYELGRVLKKQGHAECGDQDRQQRSPEQWLVRELKDPEVHHRGADHRDDEGDDEGQVDGKVLEPERHEQGPA